MDVFGALADPIRRDLLERLARGEARAGDLADAHSVSRPAISRHLRILREVGLVHATGRGRERHYALDRAPLGVVASLLARLDEPVAAAGADDGPRRRGDSGPPIGDHHLDALATETRRAVRDRRDEAASRRHAPPSTREDIA